MNKYTNPQICGMRDVTKIRAALDEMTGIDAKNCINGIFDAGTFVETSAYTKRGISDYIATEKANELEGVITGYGAIDGKLVFAFIEDSSRMGGFIDDRHAKKITDLYKSAISNGAPVIGVFDSTGIDVFEGTASLAAYGKIIAAVNRASGVIPQIAYVAGKCIGTSATISAMFDFVVKNKDAEHYVSSPTLTHVQNAQSDIVSFCGEEKECFKSIKDLISFLPCNSASGVEVTDTNDNLNRSLGDIDFAGDALSAISVISDNNVFIEVGHDVAPGAVTALAVVGGVKCGIVANSYAHNEGKLCSVSARKIARFVNFCDSFSIPVVTLVDSLGVTIDNGNEVNFAPELAKLAFAYASSTCPKVTVIIGHAIGAAFVLLGSKALGADLVYALDTAEIGALNASSGVAFAWDKYITEEKTRNQLIEEWRDSVSSPVVAAASGEIDDIISMNELRARICSALLMLSDKGFDALTSRKVLPL